MHQVAPDGFQARKPVRKEAPKRPPEYLDDAQDREEPTH